MEALIQTEKPTLAWVRAGRRCNGRVECIPVADENRLFDPARQRGVDQSAASKRLLVIGTITLLNWLPCALRCGVSGGLTIGAHPRPLTDRTTAGRRVQDRVGRLRRKWLSRVPKL